MTSGGGDDTQAKYRRPSPSSPQTTILWRVMPLINTTLIVVLMSLVLIHWGIGGGGGGGGDVGLRRRQRSLAFVREAGATRVPRQERHYLRGINMERVHGYHVCCLAATGAAALRCGQAELRLHRHHEDEALHQAKLYLIFPNATKKEEDCTLIWWERDTP